MDFNEVQRSVVKTAKIYGERFNIKINQEFVLLKLMEELGELAEAVLTFDGKSRSEKLLPPEEAKKRLAMEIADVVGLAMVAADVFDVDLAAALALKWINRKD